MTAIAIASKGSNSNTQMQSKEPMEITIKNIEKLKSVKSQFQNGNYKDLKVLPNRYEVG